MKVPCMLIPALHSEDKVLVRKGDQAKPLALTTLQGQTPYLAPLLVPYAQVICEVDLLYLLEHQVWNLVECEQACLAESLSATRDSGN